MPEHVLISEIEIITDYGRRRWCASEKLRIVEETLEEGTSYCIGRDRPLLAVIKNESSLA